MDAKLTYTTERTNFVDYSALERYITAVFKLDSRFEILSSANDVDYRHDVSYNMSEEDADETLAIILSGSAEYWELHSVLEYLCQRGHIKAGVWVVQVSW